MIAHPKFPWAFLNGNRSLRAYVNEYSNINGNLLSLEESIYLYFIFGGGLIESGRKS